MNTDRLVFAAFLSFVLLDGAVVHGQETGEKPKKAATEVTKGSVMKVAKPIDALKVADEAARPKALVAVVEHQMASNALYTGQFANLKAIEGVPALLEKWISTPPSGVKSTVDFRDACIRALRDVHADKAPESVIKVLKGFVAKPYEDSKIRQQSIFALAQFGDRSGIDRMVAYWRSRVESPDKDRQGSGHNGLANVYYQSRQFKLAAASYKSLLALHEAKHITLSNGGQSVYYNAACSMALAGMKDEAITYVGKAFSLGGRLNPRMLHEDMDIASLRSDPRFKKLLAEYSAPKSASSKKSATPKPTSQKSPTSRKSK